jgi:predicted CoA-binding protein
MTTPAEIQAKAAEITEILDNYRVVAVVGLSADPDRPSHQVAHYMQVHGYRIVPEIPFPVEVVDIFRKVEAIPEIVDDAIAVGAKVVWMQQGLEEPDSAHKARQAGLSVVMDRCMKIEHHQRHQH